MCQNKSENDSHDAKLICKRFIRPRLCPAGRFRFPKSTAAWDLEPRSKPCVGRPFLKKKFKADGPFKRAVIVQYQVKIIVFTRKCVLFILEDTSKVCKLSFNLISDRKEEELEEEEYVCTIKRRAKLYVPLL